MKEILRKIRNPFKIVLRSFNRFSSFGSKTTIVALAMILCLSNVMAQDVTLLSSWTSGATKAKEVGKNRLLVVMAMGEATAPFSVTSITYGGQEMKKQIEKRQGESGTGTYASIFTLDEAGINAATSDQIVDTWAGLTNMANKSVYSAFLINVDQTKPIGDTASFKVSSGTTLSAAPVYAANGDMVLQSSGFAGNTNSTMINGFTLLFESNSGWGDGIGCVQMGADANITPGITQSAAGRMALCAIVVKKAKNLIKTPVVPLGSWTLGATKAKEVGNNRVLVVMAQGESNVLFAADSIKYGGVKMTKIADRLRTTGGNKTYASAFILKEAGISAAATEDITVSWSTPPSVSFSINSSFYAKVDQLKTIGDTATNGNSINLLTTNPVNADLGDMILLSGAFENNTTPTFNNGFISLFETNTSWGDGVGAFKEGTGVAETPSVSQPNNQRVVLCAFVLKQGEEEGVPPTYYNLTANATGGTITIDPKRARYEAGSVVKVKATPNFGFSFVNWSDSLNGIVTDTASIVMNSNKTITANFLEKNKYTLTTEVSNGNIFLSPTGGTYYDGVVVTVSAKEFVGYKFIGWGGDLAADSTKNPATIVMNSNKTIVAIIEKIPSYTLAITATNGSVKTMPAKATYDPGEAVILIATPAEGYRFKEWTGDLTGTTSPNRVIMDSDKKLTAVFELMPPSYTLTVVAANGSVTLNPEGGIYEAGTVVTLTATANAAFKFREWTGNITGSVNPTTITMNGNKSVTAVITSTVGVDDLNNGSEQGMLSQNYPNPFSAVTTIPYQLKKDSHVRLTVYNSLGERITTLVNKNQAAGQYKVDWNAKSDNGKSLTNGIYFYRLEIDNKLVKAKKAVITR